MEKQAYRITSKKNSPTLILIILIIMTSGILMSADLPREYYVDRSSALEGDGSKGKPFRSIQQGIDAAGPGETVIVLPGIYDEEVSTVRNGLPGQPIILRAHISAEAPAGAAPGWVPGDESNRVWIRHKGRGLDILHSHIHVDGINIDGLWHSNSYIDENGIFRDSTVSGLFPSGTNGIVKIDPDVESVVLKNIEIKNNQLHLVRIHGKKIVIDNARIHSAIARTINSPAPEPGQITSNDNFRDAHGIEASRAYGLTISNTYIGYISGDCIQSGRSIWGKLTVDNCHFEMKPIEDSILGLSPGTWFGEDIYDTKTPEKGRNGAHFNKEVIFKNSELHGTKYSRILHGAILNLKEGVEEIIVEGNKIYDNRMTFRLRQPTRNYIIRNNIIYNNETVLWFAGPVDNVQVVNNTFYNNEIAVTESQNGATNSIISNNIFDSGPHKMDLQSPPIKWGKNLFHKVSSVQGNDYITKDPLFTDPQFNNFNLHDDSPAIPFKIGAQ